MRSGHFEKIRHAWIQNFKAQTETPTNSDQTRFIKNLKKVQIKVLHVNFTVFDYGVKTYGTF